MRRLVPTASRRTLRAIALAILTAPAAADPDAAPWAAIAGLESRVDLAVMIERPTHQLASAPGQALASFVTESGLFDGTLDAWTQLAASLRAEPHELTKRLLSQRVTVLLDPQKPTALAQPVIAPTRWAVLTDVSRDTERWVRDRLRAAPRDALPGATVLAIEDGRFRLAVIREPNAPTRLVFAPAESDELFKNAVAFAREHANADPRPDLPDGDIVGFANLEQTLESAPTIYWSARLTQSGWDTTLALHTAAPPAPERGIGADAFEALSRGALASLAADNPGALAQAVISSTTPAATAPNNATQPTALTLFPSRGAGPFSLQLTTRLPDRPRAPARFDELVGTYLVPFTPDAAPADTAYDGRFPAAVRTQSVVIRTPLLSRWLGTTANVAWRYTTTAPDAYAAVTCAPAQDVSAADRARRAAETLESIDNPGPPLALGFIVRPAALARALPDRPTQGPVAALRWIEELRLTLLQPEPDAPGVSRGSMTLRTAPAQPRPPTR